MPRKAYSAAQKREAVAQARVMGIAAAAESLGIDPRSIAKWSAQAGDRPELDGNAEAWQRAFDLAHAKVEAFLASGKASPVSAATIMGIAQRNIRDLERDRRPSPDAESSVAARESFHDWLIETVTDESLDSEEALAATAEAIEDVPRLLLKLANAETPNGVENDARRSTWQGNPHRHAMLAWFSGRPEIPAGDVLAWAQDQVRDALETHGTLTAWRAWQAEQDAAEEAELERVAADARAKAEEARASARQAMLDNETRSLLAAAEASLRQTSDA